MLGGARVQRYDTTPRADHFSSRPQVRGHATPFPVRSHADPLCRYYLPTAWLRRPSFAPRGQQRGFPAK